MKSKVTSIILMTLVSGMFPCGLNAQDTFPDENGYFVPPKPFIYDPVKKECGDPTILFNREIGNAWVFYTQRPHWQIKGPGWYHGSPIGILSSGYNGFSWLYRGTAEGLDKSFEPGLNTFWAPEVIYDAGKYHMYVTFLRGVPLYQGPKAHIYAKDPQDTGSGGLLYYTSANMIDWTFECRINLEPDNGGVIDAAIHPLPDGTWRMWYRAKTGTAGKWTGTLCNYADSRNLRDWASKGSAIDLGTSYAEGACVFHWKGRYWLLLCNMDTSRYGRGYVAFHSEDALNWTLQGNLMDFGQDGWGAHGSAIVQGDRAFFIYQTNKGSMPGCVGEMAELSVEDGKLVLSRDVKPMKLDASKAPKFRGGQASNFN